MNATHNNSVLTSEPLSSSDFFGAKAVKLLRGCAQVCSSCPWDFDRRKTDAIRSKPVARLDSEIAVVVRGERNGERSLLHLVPVSWQEVTCKRVILPCSAVPKQAIPSPSPTAIGCRRRISNARLEQGSIQERRSDHDKGCWDLPDPPLNGNNGRTDVDSITAASLSANVLHTAGATAVCFGQEILLVFLDEFGSSVGPPYNSFRAPLVNRSAFCSAPGRGGAKSEAMWRRSEGNGGRHPLDYLEAMAASVLDDLPPRAASIPAGDPPFSAFFSCDFSAFVWAPPSAERPPDQSAFSKLRHHGAAPRPSASTLIFLSFLLNLSSFTPPQTIGYWYEEEDFSLAARPNIQASGTSRGQRAKDNRSQNWQKKSASPPYW
ncbi:hypothetical protein BDK51DRAFT_49493 [Blyttiomyces helicus]|uniref:Uncharacterized protein n=1 Tax=Blyttiomyces helicus TaxID=388810 RepID=A0A4P9WLV2_9FUNG|nr:hypothetical protein BDK51DRAFT_49493 [Blyttiomyces helicus]|eukprot:RKO92120.1 hypothetical protein BDK51DRAFT_49493 [Blyttiomyces helicus]